ncbi:MAG: septum formation initiator family protein [Clostridia bacterium]|nr:septum formation initiator family protein [Clostridia bacterium]
MSVRNFNEAKKAKKKEIRIVHIFTALVIVAMTALLISQCVTNYARAAEYNRKAEEIENLATSISMESSEISETLKEENRQAYFEKIAREEYGYCKPGEKVYYNSSFGE